jgi:hypothetical protein
MLSLYIGPGPSETRQRLFDAATELGAPFRVRGKKLSTKWNTIYAREFISADKLDESDNIDNLEPLLQQSWSALVSGDLSAMRASLSDAISQLTVTE